MLEYWEANQWKTISTITTIGYKRLLRFKAISTSRVRLTISKAGTRHMSARPIPGGISISRSFLSASPASSLTSLSNFVRSSWPTLEVKRRPGTGSLWAFGSSRSPPSSRFLVSAGAHGSQPSNYPAAPVSSPPNTARWTTWSSISRKIQAKCCRLSITWPRSNTFSKANTASGCGFCWIRSGFYSCIRSDLRIRPRGR